MSQRCVPFLFTGETSLLPRHNQSFWPSLTQLAYRGLPIPANDDVPLLSSSNSFLLTLAGDFRLLHLILPNSMSPGSEAVVFSGAKPPETDEIFSSAGHEARVKNEVSFR